jgi:hypothetical protein
MRRIRLSIAAAVVAASFVAAPAAQASGNPLVDKAIWAVKCVGDSLGGNSCHQ